MSIDQDDDLFRTGEVFSASDQKLDDILKRLASEWNGPNLATLISVRVLIINTIKQQRHIDKIEKRNQIYTWLIIGLSIGAIIAQILPIFFCK